MTDDEWAMAYADGELDPIAARRFEARMASETGLAEAVAAHRGLRATLQGGFAPIAAAPLPERLTDLLRSNLVELRPRARMTGYWRAAAAMAACLVAGVAIGHFATGAPAGVSGGPLLASGALARSLDRQLAGVGGATRVLVSFRDSRGNYCRVFATPAIDGIACHDPQGWTLRRTQAGDEGSRSDYRQAGSGEPALLAAAQDMMAGDPLDAAAERAAKARNWRR